MRLNINVFALLSIVALLQVSEAFAHRKNASKASIVHTYRLKRMDSVQSILFVFKGDELLFDKYVHLSNRLKWRLKKKYDVGFQYDLKTESGGKAPLGWIPKNSNSNIEYDLICKVLVYDIVSKRDKYGPHIRNRYKINLELIDPKSGELAKFGQLEVNSLASVYKNNRALAQLIKKIITE